MISYLAIALIYIGIPELQHSKIPPAKVVIYPSPVKINATTDAGDLFGMKQIIGYSEKWGNQVILVDDDVFEELNKHRWGLRRVRLGDFYARRNAYVKGVGNNYIDMHRLIMGFPKAMTIDHSDGNTLNNQKRNLRICSQSLNAKNQRLKTTSITGYKGVSWDKAKQKYSCFITRDYQHIFGGYFNSPIQAAICYNELAIKYHGEFARLNKIPS
jgi:hypothetical protein